jgi:uncharacterized FlgJ-related protein
MRTEKKLFIQYIISVVLLFLIIFLSYEYFKIKSETVKNKNIINQNIQILQNYQSEIQSSSDSIAYLKHLQDSLTTYLHNQLEFNRNLYKFNWENVCYWVDYYQIKHPEIVKGQILLETNYLTSEVCRYNHNLFGMKLPNNKKGRKGIGVYKNHAVYNNYIESIEDYKIWQDRYYKYEEDYYKFLRRLGYAKDGYYISKLKYIVKHDVLKEK